MIRADKHRGRDQGGHSCHPTCFFAAGAMRSAWATLPANDIAVATISQHQKKRAAAQRASTTSEPITTTLASPVGLGTSIKPRGALELLLAPNFAGDMPGPKVLILIAGW